MDLTNDPPEPGREQSVGPLKVLGTLTTYPPSTGGAQLHQHTLFRHMHPDVRVQVATFWSTNRTDWLLGTTLRAHRRPESYQIDGIDVRRLGMGVREKLTMAPWVPLYYPMMSPALRALARVVRRQIEPLADGVDVIHNVRIGREALSEASLQAARGRGIPFVLTPVHHPRWSGWRYREFNRIYREADMLFALTNSEKEVLTGLGVADERITVTGIGPILSAHPDPDAFRERWELRGPIILFLGQHYDYKGYRAILEAAPEVWKDHPDAEFVFIGPPVGDSERHFERVDGRIRRLGKVDLQEKTDALAAAAVLCVPSSQESFGGVYVEAWSLGRPVIGCRIPAVSEVISDGVDGLLVDQDAGQIARAIRDVLDDPARADRLGAAGHAKVRRKYGWDALARATVAAYRVAMG